MTKKKNRMARRASVKALVLKLFKLGYTKESLASELGYSGDAIRSWAVNDVKPHQMVYEKLEQLIAAKEI
jgi:ribosome-binding protein aMBF1 (putative translation factor)